MNKYIDKKNILIVDDDAVILNMYGDYLQNKDLNVYKEKSGEGALARIIESKNIDLMITDILMARMNGWELVDYIREDMQLDEIKLPIIVMSAVEGVELEMEYLRHKANDWIAKPIKPLAQLYVKVCALLGLSQNGCNRRN